MHGSSASSLLWLLPLALSAACSCQDYQINALDWDELDADHGQWLSMDIAPDNRLAVAYYDRDLGGLGFALGLTSDAGVRWAYEQVDGYPNSEGLNPGDVGTFCSMKVADDGTVWVSYHVPYTGSLKVAHRVGGVWQNEVVDVGSGLTPKAGLWTSLALDAEGNPSVAYHDAVKGDLRLARLVDGAWATEVVFEGDERDVVDETTGETKTLDAMVGEMARLNLNGNTYSIAYYDRTWGTLRLSEGFSGSWSHTIVDSDADVGRWPSIWSDGTEMAIAFQDGANEDLKLATRSGTSAFSVQTLDDGDFKGADTEVFMRDGKLSVVYFDGRTNDMSLATQTDDGWSLATVAGEAEALGFHNEVVQDLQGTWWAASYNYTRRKIFVTRL